MLLLTGGVGMSGIQHTPTMLENTAKKDARISIQLIERIRFKMEINRSQVLQSLQHNPGMEWAKRHDHPLGVHFKLIKETSAGISAMLAELRAATDNPDERRLAEDWLARSGNLGLAAIAATEIQQDKWDDAERILIRTINPGYRTSDVAMRALTDALVVRARGEVAAVHRSARRPT